MHTAQVIGQNVAELADQLIRHDNPEEQERRRADFVAAHRIAQTGADTISFSTICCENLDTIERHTIGRVHKYRDTAELGMVMQGYAQKAAEKHEAAVGAVNMAAQLTAGQGITACCGRDAQGT